MTRLNSLYARHPKSALNVADLFESCFKTCLAILSMQNSHLQDLVTGDDFEAAHTSSLCPFVGLLLLDRAETSGTSLESMCGVSSLS